MKLREQLGELINEIENNKYPEDEESYIKICALIAKLKMSGSPLYELTETLEKIDNVQSMMHRYLPRKSLYDPYGSSRASDNEWSYNNLAREKKRLISTLKNLKSLVENL